MDLGVALDADIVVAAFEAFHVVGVLDFAVAVVASDGALFFFYL